MPCPTEMRATLRWLREHNYTAPTPVRFAGVDVPQAGGSLLPCLRPLTEFLTEVDSDALPLLEAAVGIADRIVGASMPQSAPVWARLDTGEQDALTAALARLLHRFRALEPHYVANSDQQRYDLALWQLQGACHTDYHLRAMTDLMAGVGIPGDTSAREIYMAESVRWHLDHAEPGARIVLAAHNAHVQKTPVCYHGQLTSLPMGQHLDRMLGADYVALGVTSGAGRTAALYNDETAPYGFTVRDTALQPPEPGSIEAVFAAAGRGLSLVNLHQAPRPRPTGQGHAQALPDRIRMDSKYLHTPVLDAFDGVIHVPTSTVVDDIGL